MASKIRDIMTPAPVCMAPAQSVSAAARAMKEHGIGTVLVLDDGRLRGLVTDRDITIRVLAENRDPARASATSAVPTSSRSALTTTRSRQYGWSGSAPCGASRSSRRARR
jgi:CBS domain-containing protein